MQTKIQEIISTLLKTAKKDKTNFFICTFATIMDILSIKKNYPELFNKEIKIYDLKDSDFLKKLRILHPDTFFLNLDGNRILIDNVDLSIYKDYDLIVLDETNLFLLLIKKGSDQNMFSNWPKLLLFETIDLSDAF